MWEFEPWYLSGEDEDWYYFCGYYYLYRRNVYFDGFFGFAACPRSNILWLVQY